MCPNIIPRLFVNVILPLLVSASFARAEDPQEYKLGPDSQEQPGVPQGKLEHFNWTSKIFHGAQRDGWIYVPAQYDPEKAACMMIFQDGGGFQERNGQWRVPVVFDNLIQKNQMPVTIGIFLNPGVIPPPKGSDALPRYNRSFEYDSCTDQYARFLLEEILPEVAKKYHLATDGNSRALCGISSGGSCAFTAAWQRPREFSRVVSFVGSFTNLRGANYYPDVIRKTEPRAIRVFLQDGTHDLDIFAGSWYMANQDMASALKFAGYDYQFVVGHEGHNGKHGGAILPDALRWVWRDYRKPIEAGVGSQQPVMEIVDPAEGWQQLGDKYGFTEGPADDGHGNVYFSDIPNSKIYNIDPDGKVALFAQNTGGANGLMFGPDGKLYACQMRRSRVVAYDKDAREQVVAEDLEQVNDICINHEGGIYVSEPPKHQVWYISPGKHEKKVVAKDPLIEFPNGVLFTPDQSQIIVADTKGVRLWAFQVHANGDLANREAFFDSQILPGQVSNGSDGMTVDKEGRLYVCTHLGLQVFDEAGRVNAIIPKPQDQWIANVTFGGPNLEYLYVCNGDHVYRRKSKTQGVLSWREPLKPKAPHLKHVIIHHGGTERVPIGGIPPMGALSRRRACYFARNRQRRR